MTSRRLRIPQTALRPAEERGRGLVGLAVVHPHRRAAAGGDAAGRAMAPSCANGCCGSPGIPPTSGRPNPARTSSSPAIRCARTTSRRYGPETILCRPAIVTALGNQVTFADGSCERVDAIICATGYRLDIPYLSRDLWAVLGPDLRLHHRTMHPDLPGFGVVGQFALQGPYFPLLELQARWIVNSWSGGGPEPDARARTRERCHGAAADRLAQRPRRHPGRCGRSGAGRARPPRPGRAVAVRADAAAALSPRRARRPPRCRGDLPRPVGRIPTRRGRARRHRRVAPMSATATCSPRLSRQSVRQGSVRRFDAADRRWAPRTAAADRSSRIA